MRNEETNEEIEKALAENVKCKLLKEYDAAYEMGKIDGQIDGLYFCIMIVSLAFLLLGIFT